jgi:hypothetical protein
VTNGKSDIVKFAHFVSKAAFCVSVRCCGGEGCTTEICRLAFALHCHIRAVRQTKQGNNRPAQPDGLEVCQKSYPTQRTFAKKKMVIEFYSVTRAFRQLKRQTIITNALQMLMPPPNCLNDRIKRNNSKYSSTKQ